MIAIDENFRISETGGTGNATIFVNATTENPFTTASTQIEVSSSVGNIKRYVTLNKKAAHGYMYTPVEWISNEDINSQIWIDLGYTWTNTSKAEMGIIIPTGNTANGTEIFGEWFDWTYRSGQYEPVSDTDDLRLFFDGSKCYWDTPDNHRRQLSYEKGKAIIWQFGNQYLNNVNQKTTDTGTTVDIGTRTSTVGLFGAPASGGYTHKARFYYVKIWEGDTLVRDIIPVLDKDNIPCFLDKANATFYYYKVNGVPSTGLTAGGAIAEYSYIDNGGVTSSVNCYIPINYVWKTNSRAVMSLKVQSAQNGHIFSDEDGSNRLRLYPNSYGKFQMEYRGTTIASSSRGWSNVQNIEMGNYYIKDTDTGTDIATGTTKTANQTSYCFLFGYADKIQFYSVKIYEGDTLVCDLVPAMANNGYKGFWDKKREQFFFDRGDQNSRLYVGTKIQDIVVTQIYSESDITISNETPSTAINVGTTFNLNASTTPTGATLTYSSSDTSIATVDSNGVVTAVGKGTATITITAQAFQDNINKVYYKGTSKTVTVECAYPTQQITISNNTPSEAVGIEGTFDLNVSTTPTGATVAYSSSDTSVATVSNQGIVTGIATGTTTITIVAEGFDDDVNHITYTSASTTVSITVADGVVETYDFVNGDGSDYIITDYAPNSNSVIEVKFKSQDSYGNLIGFRNDNEYEVFCFEDGRGYVYITVNNDRLRTQSSGGVIKQNGSSVEVDGSPIGSTSYISNTDNLPLYIFALNREGSADRPYNGKIYYVKVWENDTLVHEWVGATKGNKVGVYDTVTSVFTASQNNTLNVFKKVLPEDSKYFLIKSSPSRGNPAVSFSKYGTPSGSLYYRVLGNVAWTEVTGDTNVDLAGEIGYVELKGSIHNNEDNQWQIGGMNIEPQGYLAALARNEEITSSNNSIAGTYAKFYNLFNKNNELTNITNIIFPTDTDPACYKGMFINCNHITTAPILPATSLKSECYKEMFKNCFELRTIPSAMLPSTSLKEDCYYGMFEGCFSITTGPDLPAPSTIQGCYYRMFYGCSALTELRVSFTNTPGSHINYWLSNIWSPGTLYAPSNATYSASDLQLPSTWTLSKTL